MCFQSLPCLRDSRQWVIGKFRFAACSVHHVFVTSRVNREIDQQASMNEGSWSYNTNFVELDLMHVAEKSAYTVVRRRRWIRRIECIPQTSEEPIVRSTRSGSAASKAMSGTDSPASKSPASESFLSRAFGLSSASRKGSIKDDDRASDLQSLSMDDDVLDCEVEYEEDSVKDSDSVYGDGSGIGYANYIAAVIDEAPANKPTPMPTAPPVANAPPPVKKRNSFFSVFSSSSSSTATASAAAPTASSASSSGTSASTSVPPTAATSSVYTADPALRIQSSTLTAIGKQIKYAFHPLLLFCLFLCCIDISMVGFWKQRERKPKRHVVRLGKTTRSLAWKLRSARWRRRQRP